MKKFILGAAVLALLFTSCETEPVADEAVTAVEGKAKLKSVDSDNSDGDGCETAFGRICDCDNLNSCFSDYGISRWGWSVHLPEPGEGYFNLFAGAGQCDLDKGTYVGRVYIYFNDDKSITHKEVELIDGWELNELHLYSGDEPLPQKKNGDWTVAPGQYTNDGDVDGDGMVYVIVHADVCPAGS